MRPCDSGTVEAREKRNIDTSRALLEAMIADPGGTQGDWGLAIQRSKSVVNAHLHKLKKEGFAVERLGRWSVTKKGAETIKNTNT
jgi:predicted transcriptional regulator